ncbi:MAG: CDP-glucose 4,6-dehydratase [Lachnospiraceae bacterium]|nr:CDP-glucose 4,6-dehydratase [Lachnospiraceae bacterium]
MKKNALFHNLKFYKGKRVLVTGHTGFKGAWLAQVLYYMGAKATGYALEAEKGSLYEKIDGDDLIHNVIGDLSDRQLLEKTIKNFQPEIVIHMAAFGFVKECFDDPVRAYRTNLMGSVNLMEALRDCTSVKSIVIVSTDKVYDNKGDGMLYREQDVLGGTDAYSCSKICMEHMVKDYRQSYFQANDRAIGIAVVRASNVLAGGDHVKTRLIPSILASVAEGKPVELRNPSQTRPWQSVLDALNGYLSVARFVYENPNKYSGEWNIGPTHDGVRTVLWVCEKIRASFRGLAFREGERFEVAESETLGLDISKALEELDWEPTLACEKVIDQVVEFFKCQEAGEWEREICLRQIAEFYGG